MIATDESTLPVALAADLDGSFEALVLAFQDRLFCFALRMTYNPQDAEEITQDAFVRAYHALQGYTCERTHALALRPWLYQIALNLTRNRYRGRKIEVTTLDDEKTDWSAKVADDETKRPDSIFERDERQDRLNALLLQLPAKYREAVVLRFVEDLSYADVAEILRQPIGTIKSNVHRGVHMLRKALPSELDEVRL